MKRVSLFLLAFALLGQIAHASIVYRLPTANAAGTVNVIGNAIQDLGDDVTLAGTDRNLTSITVDTAYYHDATHVSYLANLVLNVFDSTTPGTTGAGHLLATSATSLAFGPAATGREDKVATFTFAGELVPNSFYIAVFQDPADAPIGNNFALFYGSLPNVGSTVAQEFYRPTGNPNFSVVNIGGVSGLVATINAVPEPASIALMGFGAVGLVVAARRRRG